MALELVELGLDGYSHLAQRCELHNVTQVPTTTGNASVQLATFPNVTHSDITYFMEDDEIVLDVQQAFRWVFYRVTKKDRPDLLFGKIYAKNLSNGKIIGFSSFIDRQDAMIPFQVLEFTDLNALRWCIFIMREPEQDGKMKCWKFREDSDWGFNAIVENFRESLEFNEFYELNNVLLLNGEERKTPLIGDLTLDDNEQITTNELWEVFVQGYFYDYYRLLADWDHSGTFSYPEFKKYDSLEGLMKIIYDTAISFEKTNAIVMTDELRECFKVDRINPDWIATYNDSWGGRTPAGGAYYNGLGMVQEFIKNISDTQGTSTNHEISDFEWAAIGAGTTAAAIAGGMIVPFWGHIVGAIVGFLITFFTAWFKDNWEPRWKIKSNTIDSDDENNSTTLDDPSGSALFFIGLLDKYMGSGVKATHNINGIPTECWRWVGHGINIGSEIKSDLGYDTAYVVEEINKKLLDNNYTLPAGLVTALNNDPLLVIQAIQTTIENLEKVCDSYELSARFVIWKNTLADSYRRTMSKIVSNWVKGGTGSVIRKIGNPSVLSSPTWMWDPITFKPLTNIAKVIKEHKTSHYDGDTSYNIKLFAGAIKDSINAFITDPTNSPEFMVDELQKLRTTIQDEPLSDSAELLFLIGVIINNVNAVNTRLKNLIGECDTVINAKNSDGSEMTYLSTAIADRFLERVIHHSSHPIDILGMEWEDAITTINEKEFIYPRIIKGSSSASRQLRDRNVLSVWLSSKEQIEKLRTMLIEHRSDVQIFDIESLSHMLIVIAISNKDKDNPDRFYYSDAGTTFIQGLNFYSAEYLNSDPVESWRLANRLVLFTNKTIEFWDITNDFEDPLSPAYSSNVFTYTVLQNSRVKFNDTLYFIAKPIELDTYSVYSLSKNGQIKNISYPQLDAWINKYIQTDYNSYNPINRNRNVRVNGSVINYENAPIIQWKLNDKVMILNYNVMFNTYFLSDSMYFLENDTYFQERTSKVGTLDNYFNDDGTLIKASIRTVNTNFGEQPKNKRYKHIQVFHGDVELENKKNVKRELKPGLVSHTPEPTKDAWNSSNWFDSLNPEDYQAIFHRFYTVSKMPYENMREIRLMNKQGERNVQYRINGLGLGIDFQAEISWNGYLKINKLFYEVE